MRFSQVLFLCLCISLFFPAVVSAQEWSMADGPLSTRWRDTVTPGNAHNDYPRPQMVRDAWKNLNGLWEYAIVAQDKEQPAEFAGAILVPFPVESSLSGVKKRVGPENHLWYRRTFTVPCAWEGRRVLLHFGAVDWEARVWVNGTKVGSHTGGYTAFSFDITDALSEDAPDGKQEIVVSAWDPVNAGAQARGKQVRNPGGIWYTPTTGIWQTVWLEPVSPCSIEKIRVTPDIDKEQVAVDVSCRKCKGSCKIECEVTASNRVVTTVQGTLDAGKTTVTLPIKDPQLWSPCSPFLYDLEVSLFCKKAGKKVDTIRSYFGMRKISVAKDKQGIPRLMLNNKALFQLGPLDQGFWPDGLYTAPCDAALRYDVEMTRKLGFNMARKHVKVEPARWYYWCDRLGLLVWQDMPGRSRRKENQDAMDKQFEYELTCMVEEFYNHPSIVMWVPFNEGWGQYDTERICAMVKKLDPSRLVNNASGWTDKGVGDVHDIHSYPGPAMPKVEEKRAAVLGEFGGLGLPCKGHTWQAEKNWGYRSYKNSEELTGAYVQLLTRLRPLIGSGLSAAVYTQTSDVEIEVNGLMTYDRAFVKLDIERVAAANNKVYLPPPVVKTVVPASNQKAQTWKATFSKPEAGWEEPGFDDKNWKSAPGGFGTKGTPGSVVRTGWDGSDIWIRRTFELKKTSFNDPCLLIHHDEDAEVFINGTKVAELEGYTSSYVRIPLDETSVSALKKGANTIAIHCRQTRGGQYIDAGLVDVEEQKK